MDVDPITQDDAVAELCYEAHIGSLFEREKGWHINLMPEGSRASLQIGACGPLARLTEN